MTRPITAACLILGLLTGLNALSIEKVSDKQNVTKREANAEFFPDWVPFKNKQGDELGEFKDVPKAKPKKRLAPPVNFILRAVAEPEGDDYFEKGQGESDGDEYFEKKDWSDLNRPVENSDTKQVNHTDLSDIEGIVEIISKSRPNPDTQIILNALNTNNTKPNENNDVAKESVEEDTSSNKEQQVIGLKTEKIKEKKTANLKKTPKRRKKYEDDIDYEEGQTYSKKPEATEEDQSESDARKASILESVDELKQRHAEEQRAISEKIKEEEIYKEEHERNRIGTNEEHDKYDAHGRKKNSDYEEYDERELSVHEKYRQNPFRTTTTTKSPKSRKSKKNDEVGKLSVFKNPQLYMIYDEDGDDYTTSTSVRPTMTSRKKNVRFSSRYTTTTSEPEDNIRISLVPQDTDAKEGEPTLFFPKTTKSKKRRKNKTNTTTAPDSTVAETVKDTASKELSSLESPSGSASFETTAGSDTTAVSGVSASGSGTGPGTSATGLDATGLGTAPSSSALETAPASDAVLTNSNPVIAVTDALSASTDHKKKEKEPENYENEKGGGRKYHADHFEQHSESGKKAYEGVHEDAKTAKGHHEKETHHGNYDDHGGHDKSHHEESGHYGDHKHEEHGKKHAKYEESGKHSKGHSTKGSHDIHKKEEYEKKVEFFEEEGDSAEEEKHGGYLNEKEHKTGGQFKKGNLNANHHQHHKGESGVFQKGHHAQGHKEHRSAGGYDGHSKNLHSNVHKEGVAAGKKWVYHHGHPAKTANLVLIDRRTDQLYHGPQYYG